MMSEGVYRYCTRNTVLGVYGLHEVYHYLLLFFWHRIGFVIIGVVSYVVAFCVSSYRAAAGSVSYRLLTVTYGGNVHPFPSVFNVAGSS